MREPEVEERLRQYLTESGYQVISRHNRTGPDIVAHKSGRTLVVEVKGDRPGHQSSPGTINVDVMTLLGQIVFRKGQDLADDYAIAIRPVHMRLIQEALSVLNQLGVEPHGFTAVVPLGSSATPRRSVSSFAKASEDTLCAFLHGLTAVASCVGG